VLPGTFGALTLENLAFENLHFERGLDLVGIDPDVGG